MLHVRTLGELRLETSDGTAVTIRRKPLALLAYVARHGNRPTSRTELATLFWGERGEDRARQSLRQTLLETKQAIGDRIEVDSESVKVQPDAIQLDIAAFEREVASGDLRAAVNRWKGDFFEGAEDIGGEGFRRWIENERAGLHRHLSTAMQRLIGDAEVRGDWTEACALAERWAGALRFDETAHLRLIEVLRMSGRAAEASTVHASFATRVRTALDVEPSPEFHRLGGGIAEDLRTEIARRGRGSAAVHTPEFTGRALEFGELVTAWETAVAGTPVVMLIQGEAGSGLTRLCEELIAHLGDKAVILRARGSGDETPYATASILFQGIRDAEGSVGASPEALAEVARIIPSLAQQFRHLPSPIGDERALSDALAQTLAAISEELPVLMCLDDAHLADDATRRLLHAVASRLTGRVMLLFTADEARGPNANLGGLLEVRGLKRLWVHALGAADVETIIGSMVTLGADERHRLATLIYEDTGGIPLHVTAVVAALVNDHLLTVDPDGNWRVSPALPGRPLPVPASLRDRARSRFERLTPEAVAIVGTIAVLGSPSTAPVIEDVAQLSPDVVEVALAELLEHRILVEPEGQPGHYGFTTPLIGRAVATLLPATKRRALHARAAEVLVKRDMAVTAERSLVPYHLARADERKEPKEPASQPTIAKTKPAWAKRAIIAGGIVAVLAGVAVTQMDSAGGSFRAMSARSANTSVPVVALGYIADYRDARAPALTKPLIDMLATNLGRVAGLRVVSTARMYELVSQTSSTADSSVAVAAAARRAGATELVDGALYTLPNGGLRLDLRRVELESGNVRESHSVNGTSVFELADSGTARLAADFGQKTPLGSVADVTTRSLPAYHLYEQGVRAYYANDKRTAERLLEAALAEDSTFAMAAYYSALAVWESRALSLERFERAARLATRTTDRERLTILARQAFVITSSPALRALADTLTVRYPDEVEGYFFTGVSLITQGDFLAALAPLRKVVTMDSLALTGTRALCNACDAMRQIVSVYQLSDSLEAAEREVRRWIRLQPTSAVVRHVLVDVLNQRGKHSEARDAMAEEAALDPTGLGSDRLGTLAIQHLYSREFDDLERLLRSALATGSADTKRTALWYQILSHRYQGRLVDALAVAKQYRSAAAVLSPRGPTTPRNAAPTYAAPQAQVLFEMGRFREAAALFDSVARWEAPNETSSQLGRSRAWSMTHAATSLAAAGDTVGLAVRADSVREFGARSWYGRDQRLHHHVRGLLLAARGDDDAAVAELRRAIYSANFGYTRTNIAIAEILTRGGRMQDAIAVLQSALRSPLESSNYYATRTELHDLLARVWERVPGAAARDSAAVHSAIVVQSWSRADPIFADRVARAKVRASSK